MVEVVGTDKVVESVVEIVGTVGLQSRWCNNHPTSIAGCMTQCIVCEPLWSLSVPVGTICEVIHDGLACRSFSIIGLVISFTIGFHVVGLTQVHYRIIRLAIGFTRFCYISFLLIGLAIFMSFSNFDVCG